MNLDMLKGRIAEALVESIFHHARYRVARIGRESHVGRLVKSGADEFMPDFLIWKPADDGLHRLLAVEVKYRSNLPEFLRRHAAETLSAARGQWPDLYFVLVTDEPCPSRSCFQGMSVRDYLPGTEPTTVDLHQLAALDIYRRTVDEHEALARTLFTALSSARHPARQVRAETKRERHADA